MTTQNRYYSNTAAATTLSNAGGLNASETDLSLATTSGWPSIFPFVARIEPGTVNEEIVLITSGLGSTGSPYVMTRGYDGTVATTHSPAVPVIHGYTELDFAEPQQHLNLTGSASAAHGLPPSAWLGGTQQIIQQISLSSTSASVSFSSIPQTFSHLMLVAACSSTGTGSSGYDNTSLTWNGLSTSTYNVVQTAWSMGSSTTVIGSNSAHPPEVFGYTWNSFFGTPGCGAIQCWIPFYSSSTYHKNVQSVSFASDGGSVGALQLISLGNITSTAPITSLTLGPVGSFTAGSMFILYGVN